MTQEFKPHYEDRNIRELYRRKILKYVITREYRDIIYFFLIHPNLLGKVPSIYGDRHVLFVEVLNDLGEINERANYS